MNSTDSLSRLSTPADFAKASGSYRLRVWLAMLGLILFVVLYVGLAGWFTYTFYRMIAGVFAGGEGAVAAFFAALPSGFLAVFMWKALFFVRQGSDDPGLEVTPVDQPELFDFLHELADEVGAPRPHRVYLSPNVNASVFYDLSILNFFLPSKKNLTIGLGLVNALNRSEIKAVLAHEFGHFAQRSMAVGRWVYVGEQIAGHIIAKRDALDRTLDFISHIDIRIAWIGWIMRTIVWSIRSLMESVFRWVVLAHRALSREMEFQADLVSVSVTGSDAPIHALYRIQAADEDWDRTLSFANMQLAKGKAVKDLFAVQTKIGEHMRRVLNDPLHGLLPETSSGQAADRRLFTEQLAQPPKMWSTHPPNTEREENAKRVYIPTTIDNASAWTLFSNPQQLREDVTDFLFDAAKLDPIPQLQSEEATQAALDELYSHESYRSDYRGAYLGRTTTLGVREPEQLYGQPVEGRDLPAALDELYPESLQDSIAEWRNLEEEIALLSAIEDGIYDASGGVIRHRGEVVPKSELSELIARVKQERDEVRAEIEEHDQRCRAVHDEAAKQVAQGWPEYLNSLTRLLHYVEHSEADLSDAQGHLSNTTMMATAAGRVNSEKLQRILRSANELQRVMAQLDEQSESVKLPPAILKELEAESWRAALDKLELPPANEQNIGQWIEVVDSWVIPMVRRFGALRKATLAELLRSEKSVASFYLGEREAEPAPECAVFPAEYAKRPRGSERTRQKKLDWWSRFRLADGIGPAFMRFAVASSIVAAVVLAGLFVGNSNVIVYNGLATTVEVTLNEQMVRVEPQRHKSISVGARRTNRIVARTLDGREIESFEASIDKAFANYVYNVAGAAPMVEWTAVYGNTKEVPPVDLGYPRWRVTGARFIFEPPPRQIKTSGGGGKRSVLSSEADAHPQFFLAMVNDLKEQQRVIRTHAKWDSSDSRNIAFWLSRAEELDDFKEILEQRLKYDPDDVMVMRVQQDSAKPGEKSEILERHRELAQQHPNDPDWQYIGIRAMPDGEEQDEAFLEAFQKWPNNVWLSNAVAFVHTHRTDWEKALEAFKLPLHRSGPWTDTAAIQVARIRRFLAGDQAPNLNDLKSSTGLTTLLTLESGENLQGLPVFSYSLLNKGQIAQAWNLAGKNDGDRHLVVLLAASSGAKKEWQQQALQYPLEEINDATLHLYLAALAVRNGQPYEPYLEKFEELYPAGRRSPLEYVRTMIEQGRPSESLADDITGLDCQGRGVVLSTALILSPDDAKESWKKAVQAMLFAVERPSF